jgi:hypothetical protein
MTKNFWVLALGALFALASAGSAYAMTGTQYGTVALPGGQSIPAKGELTFVAYLNGTDDVIHTENAFNCALGLGNGYHIQDNAGYWLVNFSNFQDARVGDSFTVHFTASGNLQGSFSGAVPAGLTGAESTVLLSTGSAPLVPANVRAQRADNGVVVNWNAELGLTYKVYRADLPSGANNTASRGIYNKVAEVTDASFTDTTVQVGQTYWYLVVAVDKNGLTSGHSAEVRALPATQFSEQPQLQKQNLLQDGPQLQRDKLDSSKSAPIAQPE